VLKHWRLKMTDGWGAMVGLFGIGFLPCPDCGLPMAVHTWPIALLIWAFRRVRQRQSRSLDLLLDENVGQHQHAHAGPDSAESPQEEASG